MNKHILSLIFLAFLLITGQSIALAKVNLPIMVTNSPYSHGINDTCGGCVSPATCQNGTCVAPSYSTDSADCGASQTACGSNQACISGSCVSATDAASCFNGTITTTCANGTCGGTANLPGQGNLTMTGICACPNGIINDNNNCGSCGTVCSGSTAYCSFGQCVDANLCGDGGCAGTNCAGAIQIGSQCSDTTLYGKSTYAGGNLELSAQDAQIDTWAAAVSYCAGLNTGGVTGWALPTQEQLMVLYANNSKVGMSTSATYWSSTQFPTNASWIQSYNNGAQSAYMQSSHVNVRCVRSLW